MYNDDSVQKLSISVDEERKGKSMSNQSFAAGLEDVIAGTSDICFIDGVEGRLLYRGYDIHDLAKSATFEEVVYLLWYGALPTHAQLAAFSKSLRAVGELPSPVIQFIKTAPKTAVPMEVLRTAISLLANYDADAHDMSREANLRKSLRLTSYIAQIVAAIGRVRAGKDVVMPRTDLSHAGNFLYMLFGKEPDGLDAQAFDVALTLHADHELNASTFAARVTAATLSDMHSAITSAVGALKGPLHGGANEAVMRMLLEIGSPEQSAAWIRSALANKVKISGFGHRVYRTLDPRAVHLKEMSAQLGQKYGQPQWVPMQETIQQAILDQKKLYPNVDYYSATAYYSMGIPIDLFTPIFAVSRISGWTAHVLEQYGNNRIIRPRAEYTGATRATWVPIDERQEA